MKVITDSAADIPERICGELNIGVVPLTIRFGDTEYIDKVNLKTDKFWELCLAAKELPQTAAPSPGQFQEAFEKARADGFQEIVCITLSSSLSATFQSATLAAEAVSADIDVAIIDSRSATVGQGGLVLDAATRAAAGAGLEEIQNAIKSELERVRVFGALDTLDHLKRGGRIGAATALLGSLLSFKPLIEIRDGVVEPDGRQRTRSRALNHLIEKVSSHHGLSHLAVVHAQAPDIDDFLGRLSSATGIAVNDIFVSEIGPVIGTHAGPRTLGVSFWTE